MATGAMSLPQQDKLRARYDRVTMTLHWLTAATVIVLFGTSLLWNYLPRTVHWRGQLESLHISFGIILAAIFIGRALWRAFGGRHLVAADAGLAGLASKIVHWALYLLLAVQIALGFALRWLQGEEFSFFGLFSVPSLLASNRSLAHTFEDLHNLTAWTLIVVAGGHAAAALWHHYIVKDGVLRRMLPATRAKA